MTVEGVPVCEREGCEGTHPTERHLEVFPVETLNESMIHSGQNMPNHSASLAGRGRYVKVGMSDPIWRTKQAVYRFAAFALTMAELLPDEEGAHTFDEVLHAIRNA